ncbi:MAG: excinuclease ABC subunit UvrC [Bacilli bacterium]|nr:excinuclease ABC subunit UvrC [Bacilli bacterium]
MLSEKLKLIPHLPGSYQMRNKDGIIIYVGKAKDLYKRVNSYFKGTVTGKTRKMVSEVVDFTYIVTNSETEAFITEINLIKEYNPKYNILLKDDKSYPYIEYISKPYPQVKVSRYLNIKRRDNKTIFGPYPNAYAARRIVKLINRLYPLKKCEGMPKNVCLYYHIGECLGYCNKNIDKDKLQEMEAEILSFLRGNDKILKDRLLEKINTYSESLNYEMAKELTEELNYINIVLDKQKVELHDFVNRDIIGFYLDKGHIGINILFVRNNKLIGSHNEILTIKIDPNEELNDYVLNFYTRHEVPKEILVDNVFNKEILSELIETNFVVPEKGIKKKILNMAEVNAKIYLENEIKTYERNEMRSTTANEELAKLLNIDNLRRIDAFDNSNLFGSYSVSGMVVFVEGMPYKKEYRKYKISLEKNDDYNTMKEVIYRRYQRALVEGTELPDLIIVDGGINQINACLDTLNLLNLNIKVCGLKKNDKHRTNELIDGDTYSIINIDKDSNVFHYLTRIQDEVHRFTINYHKTLRSKGSISSILDSVEGIGNVRKKELIKKYGNINNIKNASVEELSKIIPEAVAKELKNFLINREKLENKKD